MCSHPGNRSAKNDVEAQDDDDDDNHDDEPAIESGMEAFSPIPAARGFRSR